MGTSYLGMKSRPRVMLLDDSMNSPLTGTGELREEAATARTRIRLAFLISGHVLLAFLVGIGENHFIPWQGAFWDWLEAFIALSAYGIALGQIGLVAAWLTLAGQVWFLRIPRGLALFAWYSLSIMTGSRLFDGDWGGQMYEESLAFMIWILSLCCLPFFVVAMWTGKRFYPRNQVSIAAPFKIQFGILTLLLLTLEIGALLALYRVAIPWNRRWWIEILDGLKAYWEYRDLTIIAGVATIVPTLLVGLALSRRRMWLSLLTAYLLAWSLGTNLFFVEAADLLSGDTEIRNREWWNLLILKALPSAGFHFSAAGVILGTLWIVRRIGYDFLPRPGRPGRGLPNACSSSAKSSA